MFMWKECFLDFYTLKTKEFKIPNALCFQLSSREKAANDYNQKLKEKFQYHPQVKRIARHRHLPKPIYSQIQEQRVMKEARRRKYV